MIYQMVDFSDHRELIGDGRHVKCRYMFAEDFCDENTTHIEHWYRTRFVLIGSLD